MVRNIHLIGICGVAMGTLAQMLHDRGFAVSGSDQNIYPPMSDILNRSGMKLYSGFSADRALDLKAVNALNELRLGRLASADRGLRDDYAAAVYGQMSSPADAVPVTWLDAEAPSPRLLMEG